MLVTQNIDNLHFEAMQEHEVLCVPNTDPRYRVAPEARIAHRPHIYEIHGNTNFMHCGDD